MAEKKEKQPQKAASVKPAPTGGSGREQRGQSREQREDRRKKYIDAKLRKASLDTYEVISRRTDDTNDFIGLLNSTDNLVLQLRRRMDREEKLTAEVVSKHLKRYRAIREQLNEFNIEVSALLGYEYVPPRGMAGTVSPADNKIAKAA